MKRISEIMAMGLKGIVPAIAAGALCASCSMFHDDLPECATRPRAYTKVHFNYEYNTYGENLFLDNVGAVTLYVCDENGLMLQQVEHIVTPEEIEAGGTDLMLDLPIGSYQLYAAGHASNTSYEEYLLNPGARFRRSEFSAGSHVDDFHIALDHLSGTVDHQQVKIEDLWVTHHMIPLEVEEPPMPAEGAEQPEDVIVEADIELQRVTNHLHLTVVRDGADTRAEGMDASDYEIWVESNTGIDRIDLVGQPAQDAAPLRYTPHSIAPGETLSSLLADISMSRLFYNDDTSKNARLFIRSNATGEIFSWDLADLLAKGVEADAYAARGWTKQEYLDREYDYTLSVKFNEKDDGWRYIEVSIAVLNWAKRIQNVAL